MHNSLLTGVLLVLALGLPLVLLARRLGVSALVAYLATGVLVGVLGFIERDSLHTLAEMGASLLLFSLGLEMDLVDMRRRLKRLIIAASVQIGSTLLVGFLVMLALGQTWQSSVMIGACLTLSSTLMVLRALEEKRLRNREEGQQVLGLLLGQDVAIGPLMVLIAVVLGTTEAAQHDDGQGHGAAPWMLAVGVVGLIIGTWLLRKVVASQVVTRLQAAQLPELEVAFAVTMALGSAWLTETAGLGAAVGAFCAGLALGGDEHRHAIETATRPLQGLMAILFFVSIGVQFDVEFVLANVGLVIGALVVSMVLKAMLAGFAMRLSGLSVRSSIGAGIMVGQIGEFSFVLASAAYRGGNGPLDVEIYQLIVAVAVLSLAATPLLVALASQFLPRVGLENITSTGDVVLVAGLGPVGNTVVNSLHEAGYRLLLVDRNEKLLDPWRSMKGIVCHQGRIEDMEDWLPVLGERPRVVILTFPIPDASAVVAERLRRMDPNLLIIARSPFISQIQILTQAGVQHVICDEEAVSTALEPLLRRILGDDERSRRWSKLLSRRSTTRITKVSTEQLQALEANDEAPKA